MNTRLHVGNLSYDTTEDEITELFARDARGVEKVTIVNDRQTGKPRGFAFVEMASEDDAQAAIEAVNGTELHGRAMKVSEAKAPVARSDDRGGRGDRDRGGRERRSW